MLKIVNIIFNTTNTGTALNSLTKQKNSEQEKLEEKDLD